MTTFPPLTDTAAWRKIIANKAHVDAKPEEILRLYDTRDETTDFIVERAIQHFLTDRFEAYAVAKEGSTGGERISAARLVFTEALLNPTSRDGIGLREDFSKMLSTAWDRARGKEYRYRRRNVRTDELRTGTKFTSKLRTGDSNFGDHTGKSGFENLDQEAILSHLSMRAAPNITVDDIYNEIIDAEDRRIADLIKPRRQKRTAEARAQARAMTRLGIKQIDIAAATKYSVRQIYRWQREFEAEANASLVAGKHR